MANLGTVLKDAQALIDMNDQEKTPEGIENPDRWYRRQMLKFHPDKAGELDPKPTQEQLDVIKQAAHAAQAIKERISPKPAMELSEAAPDSPDTKDKDPYGDYFDVKSSDDPEFIPRLSRQVYDQIEQEKEVLQKMWDDFQAQLTGSGQQYLLDLIQTFRGMMDHTQTQIMRSKTHGEIADAVTDLKTELHSIVHDEKVFHNHEGFKKIAENIKNFIKTLGGLILSITNPEKAKKLKSRQKDKSLLATFGRQFSNALRLGPRKKPRNEPKCNKPGPQAPQSKARKHKK